MPREIVKVPVGCQHRQLVTETELGQQCIDRSDLDAGAAAFVSQFGSVYMRFLAPEKPCRSSCSTSPVVTSSSQASIARTSSPRSSMKRVRRA
jgi:hypothetical protein